MTTNPLSEAYDDVMNTTNETLGAAEPLRDVVLGRNSSVWRRLSKDDRICRRFASAISHADLGSFVFCTSDRVWVFGYSRYEHENSRLLETLRQAHVAEVIYVSSASTIVSSLTRCYEYPRVKMQAEREARRALNARILTLGLVYEDLGELPSGDNAATSLEELKAFLLDPRWPADRGESVRLFKQVRRGFESAFEASLFRAYASLQWRVRHWPCVLRPVDLVLRWLGFRWYGYVQLSNRLWITTTS